MGSYYPDQGKHLSILNSIQTEIVFCDMNHNIFFINDYAKGRNKDSNLKIGNSLFSCYEKNDIHRIIKESLSKLENGENKVLLYKSEKTGLDTYLVAIRDKNRDLIGYWEQVG